MTTRPSAEAIDACEEAVRSAHDGSDGSLNMIEAAFNRLRAELDTAARELDAGRECEYCNGRGEIGGFVSMDSGYQTDPCPHCSHPPAAEVGDDFIRAMCRIVASNAGEDFDSLGEFTQQVLMDTQRASLTSALADGKPNG